MKKKWFYLAATLLLAGCAEDAFEDTNMQETTERQEIKLSAGTTGISVASRGVGAIGGNEGEATNVWGEQTVYVWSFKRNLTSFDLNDVGSEGNSIHLKAQTATTTPNLTNNTSPLSFGSAIFYPLTNAYHFGGYYIDDITNPTPGLDTTTGDILLPITIDGTQDIMTANSQLSYTQKTTLVEALKENGKISYTNIDEVIYTTDDETNGKKAGDPKPSDSNTDELIAAEYEKAFSSYTARRGLQPNLVFEHKLAKLNFKIKAGDEKTIASVDNTDPANLKNLGVYITNIGVSSLTTGNIRITKNGQIDFTDATTAGTLNVGSKDDQGKITTLTSKGDIKDTDGENGTNDPDQVGEGLLVIPAETYTAQVTVKQEYDREGNYITDTNEQTKTYNDVEIKINGGFLAGHSYDIIITVYSNQEINITATLTGWVSGGSVNISPEDDEWNDNQNTTNP